jgi:hypothetical protein
MPISLLTHTYGKSSLKNSGYFCAQDLTLERTTYFAKTVLWRAAWKPEYLSQKGRPLPDNGSVTMVYLPLSGSQHVHVAMRR